MSTVSATPERDLRSWHEPTGVAVHDLRLWMRAVLSVRELEPDRLADVLLVIEELVANVVDHAHTEFSVNITFRADRLKVAVRDGCDNGPVLQPHDVTAIRGRGLQLVEGLSEQWGCEQHVHGKTVWAVLAV